MGGCRAGGPGSEGGKGGGRYLVRCNRVSNPMQIECSIMSGPACGCWGNFPNLGGDIHDDGDDDDDDDNDDDNDDDDGDDDDEKQAVAGRSP